MKIAVSLVIEIPDTGQWMDTFGGEGPAEVREDVKNYVHNLVQQAAVWDEVDGEVHRTN